LWTPDYRVALAGQGWNSYCHHGLVAHTGSDAARTADYFAVEFDVNEEAKQLTVRGKIRDVPLHYRRTYRFGEDRVSIETHVQARDAISTRSCDLQFPVFTSKERGFRCTVPSSPLTRIAMRDNTGAGLDIRFTEPLRASWGHTSKRQVYPIEYVVRQLKVALPTTWRKGQEWRVEYEIATDARD
jgi:hypothetical protein